MWYNFLGDKIFKLRSRRIACCSGNCPPGKMLHARQNVVVAVSRWEYRAGKVDGNAEKSPSSGVSKGGTY